jgi:hypothetical protein
MPRELRGPATQLQRVISGSHPRQGTPLGQMRGGAHPLHLRMQHPQLRRTDSVIRGPATPKTQQSVQNSQYAMYASQLVEPFVEHHLITGLSIQEAKAANESRGDEYAHEVRLTAKDVMNAVGGASLAIPSGVKNVLIRINLSGATSFSATGTHTCTQYLPNPAGTITATTGQSSLPFRQTASPNVLEVGVVLQEHMNAIEIVAGGSVHGRDVFQSYALFLTRL